MFGSSDDQLTIVKLLHLILFVIDIFYGIIVENGLITLGFHLASESKRELTDVTRKLVMLRKDQ